MKIHNSHIFARYGHQKLVDRTQNRGHFAHSLLNKEDEVTCSNNIKSLLEKFGPLSCLTIISTEIFLKLTNSYT